MKEKDCEIDFSKEPEMKVLSQVSSMKTLIQWKIKEIPESRMEEGVRGNK